MIRSQSITFTEKRKTGILNSLRNRKSSSKDLNGFLKSKPLNHSNALNTDAATKRHSMVISLPDDKEYNENKENFKLSYTDNNTKHTGRPDARGSEITILKDKQVSRSSLRMFQPTLTPPSSERTLATTGQEPCDVVLMETLSLDPLSPGNSIDVKTKLSMLTPLSFEDYVTYLGQFDDEPSTPSKLHRTVNINNLQDFLKNMDEHIIPLGNRKSLDVEAYEIQQLQRHLSNQRDDLRMYLVENAMVMKFFLQSADEEFQRLARHWDDIDTDEIFKSEKYNMDENIHMYM